MLLCCRSDSSSPLPHPPLYLPGNPANAAPLPLIDEMDLSIQCNPAFLRSTVSRIVGNQSAATNSRLPLGLVCKPMAGDVGTDNDGTNMLVKLLVAMCMLVLFGGRGLFCPFVAK